MWEPRQQSISTSSSSGGSGGHSKKRQRDRPQSRQGRQGSRLQQSFGTPGMTARNTIICHKCGQPGHYRNRCTQPERGCFTCGQPGHNARECPQGTGGRSESGSVQQQGTGQVYGQQYQLPYGPGGSGSGSRGDRTGSSSASATRGGLAQGPISHGGAYAVTASAPPMPYQQQPDTSVVRGTFLIFNS